MKLCIKKSSYPHQKSKKCGQLKNKENQIYGGKTNDSYAIYCVTARNLKI